jgi:hypothetical protein
VRNPSSDGMEPVSLLSAVRRRNAVTHEIKRFPKTSRAP